MSGTKDLINFGMTFFKIDLKLHKKINFIHYFSVICGWRVWDFSQLFSEYLERLKVLTKIFQNSKEK